MPRSSANRDRTRQLPNWRVIVGNIDTGLHITHTDLAPNVDFTTSVSCIGGVPNTAPVAWNHDNGHGTHTAGTIAAAKNGIGIVGVASNAHITGIKQICCDAASKIRSPIASLRRDLTSKRAVELVGCSLS